MISLDIHLVEYRSLNGSSYIKLSGYFQRKKVIIITKSKDDQYFKWCIAEHLIVSSYPKKISDLKGKTSQLNFKGIEFPVKLRDTYRFEK